MGSSDLEGGGQERGAAVGRARAAGAASRGSGRGARSGRCRRPRASRRRSVVAEHAGRSIGDGRDHPAVDARGAPSVETRSSRSTPSCAKRRVYAVVRGPAGAGQLLAPLDEQHQLHVEVGVGGGQRGRRLEPGDHAVGDRVARGSQWARTPARRSSSRSVVTHRGPRPRLDQGARSFCRQRPAGGADAADRHAEVGGDLGVVGPVLEGHDPQQRLAPLGQPVDGVPEPVVAVAGVRPRPRPSPRRAAGGPARRPRPAAPGRWPWRPSTPRGGRSW